MFSRFVLNIDKNFFKESLEYYYNIGMQHLEHNKKVIDSTLKKYYCNNKSFSAKLIESDWFPNINADVFLSHSGRDDKLVVALAGWLSKHFGLKCFVDCLVWHRADYLASSMNSLSHEDAAMFEHSNMILNIALLKMIDKVESVFLVNTDNVTIYNSDTGDNYTYSPWIYAEIMYAKLIRRKPLLLYRTYPINEEADSKNMYYLYESILVQYPLDLRDLVCLDVDMLRKWHYRFSGDEYFCFEDFETEIEEICRDVYPLDILYRMTEYKYEMMLTRKASIFVPHEDVQRFINVLNNKSIVNDNAFILESVENCLQKKCRYKCPICFRRL